MAPLYVLLFLPKIGTCEEVIIPGQKEKEMKKKNKDFFFFFDFISRKQPLLST